MTLLQQLYEKPVLQAGWEAFKSHGYPGPEYGGAQPRSFALFSDLPPLLRTLLFTDGTVTRSLEAFFWEPVEVKQLALSSVVSPRRIPWAGAEAGEKLLLREVELVGEKSFNVYASAYSVVRLDAVPPPMREQLENGGIGIGVLIRESGLESFRELLDVGTATDMGFDGEESGDLNPDQSEIVYRTYRIYLDKRPAMLVTEKFPKNLYRANS